MIKADQGMLPDTCGVSVLFSYSTVGYYRPISHMTLGGIGYAVAGFIDNDVCRQAYAEMCERFHLEYQSPVKRNPNSGNNFFFCIFRNK